MAVVDKMYDEFVRRTILRQSRIIDKMESLSLSLEVLETLFGDYRVDKEKVNAVFADIQSTLNEYPDLFPLRIRRELVMLGADWSRGNIILPAKSETLADLARIREDVDCRRQRAQGAYPLAYAIFMTVLVLALLLFAAQTCINIGNSWQDYRAKTRRPPQVEHSETRLTREICASVGPFATGIAVVDHQGHVQIGQAAKAVWAHVDGGRAVAWVACVGYTDRRRLSESLQEAFGSNVGLAEARAAVVADRLKAELELRGLNIPVFTGSGGPRNTGEQLGDLELGQDRSVDIHVVFEDNKSTIRPNVTHQPANR